MAALRPADPCRCCADAPSGLGMSAASPPASSLFSFLWRATRRDTASRAGPGPGMGSLAAVRTVLVLGLVTGLVGCAPGLNRTVDRWEALYSRSLARIPGEKQEVANRGSDYLMGIKRSRRLYCNVGIGFHIQVFPDGRITGVHNESRYSLLQISPVERGVVTLLGVHSRRFVAMNRRGKLYGSLHYNNECKFRENLLANNYNAYESMAYPRMFIGLSKNGKTKRGNRVSPAMTLTHFLPRI